MDANQDIQTPAVIEQHANTPHGKRLAEWANQPGRYFVERAYSRPSNLDHSQQYHKVIDRQEGNGSFMALTSDYTSALLISGLLNNFHTMDERERLERLRTAERNET